MPNARPLRDPETGWFFCIATDNAGTRPGPGGLVLTNVTHQEFNFARDIRVVGLWLEVESVSPFGTVKVESPVFAPLAEPYFTPGEFTVVTPHPVRHPERTLDYLRVNDDCLDFGLYFGQSERFAAFGVYATFTSTDALFSRWPNCQVAELLVRQSFWCSRRANSPEHEPSGALWAARCCPVTRFRWKRKTQGQIDRRVPMQRLRSIRVDYRLHLQLDGTPDAPQRRPPPPANQAGLFADNESFSLLGQRRKAGVAGGVFRAAEKPLVNEVIAPGLVEGASVSAPAEPNRFRTWDNVHWWGARGPDDKLPSTPGAFHAAHLHWRWGAAVGAQIELGQRKLFAGPQSTNEAFGGLLDPEAPRQTIRLAIVENDPALDPGRVPLAGLSTWPFDDLFRRARGATPAQILDGEALVLWLAITVHGPPVATAARLLMHGTFFAHEAEQRAVRTGDRNPQHWPRSLETLKKHPQWERTVPL